LLSVSIDNTQFMQFVTYIVS